MAIYLDNAATTYPKPASVYDAVLHAMERIGATPGRAAHRMAREASAVVAGAREKVARLLDIPDPNRVLFTKNATESMNLVLKGWLRAGDRVLISGMEHNAVVRPLDRLSAAAVGVETVPCKRGGQIDLKAFRNRFHPTPRLVVLTHASNVHGGLQPVDEVAKVCEEHGVPLLLDAAQTAGGQAISVRDWRLGMLACSGHKGLLGPPGVGILYIRPDLDVLPLMEGGTGSLSEEAVQPGYCPDRYESGTPNLPGIAGLAAGIDFIAGRGLDSILKHELGLAAILEEELGGFPGLRVLKPEVRGAGIVSFVIEGLNPSDAGYLLDAGFDIAVRTGLHCAPLAHRTLGTFPEGTIRVSPGYSTTAEEIEYFLKSLRSLLSRRG
ncbi:MAG: cysteine desulfurase [Deltaproteobacteria bacterium]|nr:cysteine desulfurase [Deltaproteobacteria bacterium]